MKIQKIKYLLFFLIFNQSIIISSAQSIVYVKEGASGAGTSWSDAIGNLQEAIDIAAQDAISNNSTTQVWVAEGTYHPSEKEYSTDERSAAFVMKNNVEIYGGFAASGNPVFSEREFETYNTVLSGDIGTANDNSGNTYRVIRNDYSSTNRLDETAILDGFTVEKGNSENPSKYYGGDAIFNNYASPTIKNCKISGCNETIVYCEISSSIFENCSFKGINTRYIFEIIGATNDICNIKLFKCSFSNNETSSRLISLYDGSNLHVDSCTFEFNTQTCIHVGDGTNCLIANSVFEDNHTTEFHAAAIAFWSSDYGESSYVIRNCIFNNNSSKAEGGAIYITASDSVKIYNSLFTNNYSVNNKGGAIGIFSSDVVVTNCTFYNNESGAYIPEGASIFDDNNYGERLTINNSIMWGEQEIQLMYYDTDHWAYDGHAQPVVSNSLIKVEGTEAIFPGTNNLNTDPVFEDAVNLVLMLQASSPCLNSGNNGLCPEDEDFYHDIAGKSRIYNNDTIDMGCYEFQGEANTTFYNEMETIQLSTYPNPSTEKVIIELPNNYVDSKLEIFSITGTLVYQQKNNTNKLDINISDLITGTYLVRITNKTGGAVNSKLLKR